MHLKSIEIQGFKSFANKTVLTFLPPAHDRHSITAIVGPNGSGKSNVADAIRWVMGEQSMKMLRGKKSEDIIFAGSAAKGKMGMASVTLTIDNSDKAVPLEYDELVLTRRVYREGDSEYLINGNSVRLLDVQLLLAKAQFGQGSYSIVGQGMIDRMLLQSPQERKSFFDDASGIKELHIKRHQAALKLARTREHVTQGEALMNEVVPRLKTLSRQVKKLEERQEVELRLRELREQYYTTLWQHNETERVGLETELKAIQAEYAALNETLATVQAELAELARAASQQERFDTLNTEYRNVMKQKHDLERERAMLQGRMQAEYVKGGKQNLGWIEQKLQTLKEDFSSVEGDIRALETSQQQVTETIRQHEAELQQLTIRRVELNNRIRVIETRLMDVKHEQQLFQAFGFRAVQSILDHKNQFGSVYGVVAQLGRVAEKFHIALDVAAGAHVSSLVVGDDQVAEHCIQYLREKQLGIATFLPLNKIRPRLPISLQQFLGQSGVEGRAVDLVTYDKKFEDIFSFIFGNTLVVDTISSARKIGVGQVRMVTLAGDLLETSGSMKGGFRKNKQQGFSFAFAGVETESGPDQATLEDIARLKQELDTVEKNLKTTETALQEAKGKGQVLAAEIGLLTKKKHDVAREIASLEEEQRLQSMTSEEYGAVLKDIDAKRNAMDAEITAVDVQAKRVEAAIAELHAEEEQKKQRVFALQDTMQAAQGAVNVVSEKKNQRQIEMAKVETKMEDLANEVYADMQESIEAIVKRGVPVAAMTGLPDVQVEIQKLKYTLSLIGGIDEEVVKEYEETRSRHESLVSQLEDLTKALADLEVLIEELDTMMKKKRDRAFRQIKKEFERYFEVLFEGGSAELIEVYGEEGATGEEDVDGEEVPEDTEQKKPKKVLVGIDVVAQPPGKKINNLQALSGGERTLTSIALISAILRVNPSPFVLLDEVEAALDEANTLRFNTILRELAAASQFILITHNRATMHVADVLYGVTMGADGMSQLVSVKMETKN